MRFMALIYDAPATGPGPEPGTAEFDAMMEPWAKVNQIFEEAGVMLGGEALMPPAMATCVKVRGGNTQTMDGPFAETKEQLGGYYMFECKDLDQALHYAAMIPVQETGTIEVRPVMELGE